MPQMRKLDPEEVKAIENKGKGTRKLTEELYDSILSEYEVGDYGEATLDAGENRLTVRNRMKSAAGRRNVGVEFKRTQGDLLRFRIIEPGSAQPVRRVREPEYQPEPEQQAAPPKRKGGRPKKTQDTPTPIKGSGGRPRKTA